MSCTGGGGTSPDAAVAQDAAPDAPVVDVPATAPCATYQAMLNRGEIRMASTGYRIIVDRAPFLPYEGAYLELDAARTLVYGPQLAGTRLGAFGRVDNGDQCLWADAGD